jgi:hypothetical protein
MSYAIVRMPGLNGQPGSKVLVRQWQRGTC